MKYRTIGERLTPDVMVVNLSKSFGTLIAYALGNSLWSFFLISYQWPSWICATYNNNKALFAIFNLQVDFLLNRIVFCVKSRSAYTIIGK